MKTIFKYPINHYGMPLQMPKGAVVIHVAVKNMVPCLWALVETGNQKEERRFFVFGTGHLIPDGLTHVGTWQELPYVWHLFEGEA